MKTWICTLMVTALVLAKPAAAGETRVERKETCVCTRDAGAPPGGETTWKMETEDNSGGGPGEDVNVRVFKDGKGGEKHVVVVRRVEHGNADANNDGKVSRREFLARAEKRFAELDVNNDGSLSKEEAQRPMPPLPPIPGMPPLPPVPPVPPVE